MSEIPLVRRRQIRFDEVRVGDELPPLTKGPFSVERNVRFASVYGDFVAGHYDYKASARYNHDNIPIAYGQQVMANLSQVVTDWMGPNGTLKKFKCQVRANTYAGEAITMRGKITRKYVEKNENLVDCDIWGEKDNPVMKTGERIAVTGSATVALP